MKHIAIALLSLFIIACSGNQNNVKPNDVAVHCHIEGEVHDRPKSDKLLLYVGIDGNIALSSKPHSEIDIKNGKFTCDIYLNEAQYCEFVFEDELKQGYWQSVDFVADNGAIKMELYPMGNYGNTLIEGTGATAEYQSYKIQLRKLQNATNEVREKLKSEGRMETEEYTAFIAKIESAENGSDEQKRLVEELHKFTEEQRFTPEALAERIRYRNERKSALLDILGGEPTIAKLTMLARQMVYKLPDQEFIDVFSKVYAVKMPDCLTPKFCLNQIAGHSLKIGSRYIDFEAPDLTGQIHKLSDMIAGKKIVMLDLWASWCAPCRKASMEMIPLYNKYKNQGFEVIGVARESDSTKAMETTIKKDGYSWPQLVELDDRANIWSLYGCVNAAGRRILIDADGKIMAFDPTIEELTSLVEKHISTSKTN